MLGLAVRNGALSRMGDDESSSNHWQSCFSFVSLVKRFLACDTHRVYLLLQKSQTAFRHCCITAQEDSSSGLNLPRSNFTCITRDLKSASCILVTSTWLETVRLSLPAVCWHSAYAYPDAVCMQLRQLRPTEIIWESITTVLYSQRAFKSRENFAA